jgi:adenylate cyclase
MAFWGAPLPERDHAYRACLSALECQDALEEIRRDFPKRGWPELFARIGINTGEMVVGNMGSQERFDYTVLGDNVNLGSRLEGANKEFGTSVLISETTYEAVKEMVEARELDLIRVKGRESPVRVYELLAKKGELEELRRRAMDLFAEGLSLYRARRWQEAIAIFQRLRGDPPSEVFLGRCTRFLDSPPPEDWDGVVGVTSK